MSIVNNLYPYCASYTHLVIYLDFEWKEQSPTDRCVISSVPFISLIEEPRALAFSCARRCFGAARDNTWSIASGLAWESPAFSHGQFWWCSMFSTVLYQFRAIISSPKIEYDIDLYMFQAKGFKANTWDFGFPKFRIKLGLRCAQHAKVEWLCLPFSFNPLPLIQSLCEESTVGETVGIRTKYAMFNCILFNLYALTCTCRTSCIVHHWV